MKKHNPNQYVTAKEYAEFINKTRQRVNQLLLEGKIPGAIRIGTMWAIPSRAVVAK